MEAHATPDERLTQVETTLWGRWGTNGINSDAKRHSEQIGDLYGRDETLRKEIDAKLEAINSRLLSLTVAVAVGAIGIIGALLGTQIS